MPEQKPIVRLLSGSENLIIEPLDGSRIIAEAGDVFTGYINIDFRNWGLDKPGQPSDEIKVDVHELVENARFEQIFTSINSDLDKMTMTQHQVIRFCEKHSDWLHQKKYCGTFFLVKENNEYFVVRVRVYPVGLRVLVRRFGLAYVWSGKDHHRVVSPQLMLSEQ